VISPSSGARWRAKRPTTNSRSSSIGCAACASIRSVARSTRSSFTSTTRKSAASPSSPSIEGFRAIAARPGNYRPDENEPAFINDDALKDETNPAGLVSCAVRVWQYAHGQWFPITGVGRWEEFAPIKTVWVDNQPTDRKVLDKSGRWGDMPFLMLAKCAEAQAIRKDWPEDLSNTFVGEETEQAALTLHPAQAAAASSSCS
jgi:phage recombination protein Bet